MIAAFLQMCFGSIALALLIMVFSANMSQVLKNGIGEGE